jgi:hypothetical protein
VKNWTKKLVILKGKTGFAFFLGRFYLEIVTFSTQAKIINFVEIMVSKSFLVITLYVGSEALGRL